jgi:hypothetical protein
VNQEGNGPDLPRNRNLSGTTSAGCGVFENLLDTADILDRRCFNSYLQLAVSKPSRRSGTDLKIIRAVGLCLSRPFKPWVDGSSPSTLTTFVEGTWPKPS